MYHWLFSSYIRNDFKKSNMIYLGSLHHLLVSLDRKLSTSLSVSQIPSLQGRLGGVHDRDHTLQDMFVLVYHIYIYINIYIFYILIEGLCPTKGLSAMYVKH